MSDASGTAPPVRVLVNGALGRMGQETAAAVEAAPGLDLVGRTDLGDDLAGRIADTGAQVAVDFTVASAALANLETILRAGAAAVVGTSGFGTAEVERARALCAELGRPALIAPNFALGAVLLARYAADAAGHLPYVELLEMHHARKEDAPSGTALKVAADIAAGRRDGLSGPVAESVPGVRGGEVDGVRIHSVRVQGLLARMECVFGGPGETLTLRHDTIARASFMPGVVLAIRRVRALDGLVYGLENVL